MIIIAILAVLTLVAIYKVNGWSSDIKNYEKKNKNIHIYKN